MKILIRKPENCQLTHARAIELFSYDPETGFLLWKKKPATRSNKVKVGERAGTNCNGYRQVGIDRVYYREHRLIWFIYYGEWPSMAVDHRNGKKDDNKISNLRLATHSQNKTCVKPGKKNKSGFLGVRWIAADKKWRAEIGKNGGKIWLGDFKDKEKAVFARENAEIEHYGEFAAHKIV